MENNKKIKIVVAEDDKYISEALKVGLEKKGFSVALALNGIEAVEVVKKNNPDLLLLDIIMPEKDGFEVLEDLRKEKKHKDMPVIVFSNSDARDDVERGYKLGVKEYLVKANFTMDQVAEKIMYYLE